MFCAFCILAIHVLYTTIIELHTYGVRCAAIWKRFRWNHQFKSLLLMKMDMRISDDQLDFIFPVFAQPLCWRLKAPESIRKLVSISLSLNRIHLKFNFFSHWIEMGWARLTSKSNRMNIPHKLTFFNLDVCALGIYYTFCSNAIDQIESFAA